ncbi:hypothetical protein BDY19DRAFT_190628 [Irpex rosettiformis]|uniref:Uncharacterized protein n=1 Tax=Irpex rosettiformis TaxID=378272 RepID=A0ACB8U272_9APHY|nr:hypothetical protein BDY19DRAFT_190628 [Irpex rosettiformis]
MQVLVDGAAQDIKNCGNACDVWMKKKILLKVLVGPAWEGKLAAFTSGFAARRMEFEFALQIHTASAVDAIQSVTQSMNERLAYMSQQFTIAFSQMRSPEELRLAEIIKSKGGIEAVQGNEAVLRELWKAESSASHGKVVQGSDGVKDQRIGEKDQRAGEKGIQRSEQKFSDFKVELREDWDTALQTNLQAFEGKFKLYHDQMEANLQRYMHEESDRVIQEVTKGPHNLIRDPELRVIWQEMHWRRNVKARLFVMTLRDHFAEKAQPEFSSGTVEKPDSSTIAEMSEDSWAHHYVDIKYLQPIMDAVDDDGSGHVTITELNRFTEELPTSLGWRYEDSVYSVIFSTEHNSSLTVWLAYWAIGWQISATKYREEILQTFARMFAMRDRILPENRSRVEYYLRYTWFTASQLAKSLCPSPVNIPEEAAEKFNEYVQYEENRLRKNLNAIKYDIDALETVYGVMGPGRIEKHVLTLLALMLRRDLELFELAAKSRLNDEELWDAADSFIWVYDVVQARYQDLLVQFGQQRLDVDKSMKTIACEIFDYFHDSSSLEKMSTVLQTTEQEPNSDELPSAQLADMSPNNYAILTDCPYECEGYEAEPEVLTQVDLDAPDLVKAFLGQWSGFIHDHKGLVDKSMVSFFAHAAVDKDHHIEGSSRSGDLPFTFTASATQDGNARKIKVVICYAQQVEDRHFSGVLHEDGSIIGSQGDSEDESTHDNLFIWMRTSPDLMGLRPLPPYLVPSGDSNESMIPNKARAMFDYAIRAVILQNRKSSWAWSYFRERRDTRRRFMEFLTKCEVDDNAYESEPKELDAILRSVTNIDRRFYDSYWKYDWNQVTHHTATCDSCRTSCEGSRYICLDCIDNATEEADCGNSVDFCSLSCSQNTVYPNPTAVKAEHLGEHDILHTRTFVHTRDIPQMYGRAKQAVAYMRDTITAGSQNDSQDESKDTFQITSPDFSKASFPSVKQNAQCGICDKAVSLPHWICAHCLAQDETKPLIICDICEEHTLLKCLTCARPFEQNRRFYGFDSRDTFQCATCVAKRVPSVPIGDAPHTYLHHLVRCSVKKPQAEELTTDERVVTVDLKVDSLEKKILKLEEFLGRIEKLLCASVAGNNAT